MFYLWSVLSRELSAYMFLNKASVGAGLLLVCVGPCWCHQLHGVCGGSGDVHGRAQ